MTTPNPIKLYRESNGLTLEMMADAVNQHLPETERDCSPSNVSQWETAFCLPSQKYAKAIRLATDGEVTYLKLCEWRGMEL